MQPLISVIVPIYKVENYLTRCLDSLSGQSLTDIEILLIDDASPDRCGSICDVFAKKDARFRVFHNKENKGLAAARNIGIDNASCEWLMFVDSDDWVHEDFCKTAYECAINYSVDLVMFNYQYVKNGVLYNYGHNNVLSGYKNHDEAIELLLKNPAIWNKLYRKELFNGVRFPEGKLFEDTVTTYKLFLNTSKIYYLDKALYFYRFRLGSITKKRDNNFLDNWLEMNLLMYQGLLEKGYSKEILDVFLAKIAFVYCMKKTPDNSNAHYKFCADVMYNSKIIPKDFNWKQKYLFVLFKYCSPLFELICFLYGKKVC